MDRMKSNVMNLLRILSGLMLVLMLVSGIANAQQPSPSPTPKKSDAQTQSSTTETGEDAGNYTVISSIEVGARGLRIGGDHNKYKSDLNYNAGARLFDSS